jgi:uncharacterized protein
VKLLEPRGHDPVLRDQHYPEPAPIDAYGNGGFRFAGMSHRGSIQCLPSGIHGWAAATASDISVAALARPLAEAGLYEVLLVGTGRDILPVAADVRAALAAVGVRMDVMTTGSAARTYNIMLGENRKVAAVLLAVE